MLLMNTHTHTFSLEECTNQNQQQQQQQLNSKTHFLSAKFSMNVVRVDSAVVVIM